jgi:hypothetical protein
VRSAWHTPSRSAARFLFASEFPATISNSHRAKNPIFVRSIRQWRAGFITIGHGAPSFPPPLWGRVGRGVDRSSDDVAALPIHPLAPPHKGEGNKQIKKEAERRETLFLNRYTFRCSARLAIRARLSAFHCGSRWAVVTPQLSSRPCFLGGIAAFYPAGTYESYGPPSGEDSDVSPRALSAPA